MAKKTQALLNRRSKNHGSNEIDNLAEIQEDRENSS